MKHRNLTPLKAMAKEAGLAACANIVPRSLELDSNGRPFIVMPYYDRFLSDDLTPGKKQAISYLFEIAKVGDGKHGKAIKLKLEKALADLVLFYRK